MNSVVLQWIDLIWLPLAVAVVHKDQRWWAAGTIISCLLMMRMQVELIESTGYTHGFLGLIKADVQSRAMMVYTFFYVGYVLLAFYSPRTKGSVFMAASIGIFFMAFFSSTFIMLL